jgi:hypothetical protein
MSLYAFILCLCCPMLVAALRRVYHSSKESYRLCKKIITELKKRPGPSKSCKNPWEKKIPPPNFTHIGDKELTRVKSSWKNFFLYVYIFISNQNLQLYKLICWRKSCDAL